VTGQVFGVTPVAATDEVSDDSTMVVEVQLVTCQLMECKLDGTWSTLSTIFQRS
jgi:hypothetical protein